MKYNLLEITQAVLSSLDSDEINTIGDSVESQQVVDIVKVVYDDMISRSDLTANKVLFNLTSSNDITKPVLMYKPINIDRIDWIKYDCRGHVDDDPLWEEMRYLPVSDFIDYTHQYRPSETDVSVLTLSGEGFVVTLNYKTNQTPKFYTSFDDNAVVFDSYKSSLESTLQASKTLGYATKRTIFIEDDTFDFPALQPQQYALLLNEAKSLAWAELKQIAHPKAEMSARRGWRHLQKTRQSIPDGLFLSGSHNFDKTLSFGRRRR